MRKAIITFGVGYKFEDIRYFLESCERHCPEADIYMYVGKNIEKLEEDCWQYSNLHLIQYQESFIPKLIAKSLSLIPGLQRKYAEIIRALYLSTVLSKEHLQWFATPLLQFMVKRFFIIESMIESLPHDQFMLTDLRDVLLQSDPFLGITENTLITGIEPILNGDSAMNSNWIKKTFNEETLKDLLNLPVACAGVTIGSRRAVKKYVSEMNKEVMCNLPKIIGLLGPDQAIHIYLFYRQLIGLDISLESNGSGSIATLHYSTLEEFEMAGGLINNKGGNTLAVVHQYDRHPELASYLRSNLVSKQQFAIA